MRKRCSFKKLNKLYAHRERQRTGDTHSWGVPAGACPKKRKLHYVVGYRY